MKFLTFIVASLFVSQSFAGVGGYTATTCVSQSARTVVTLIEGDLGGPILTLIMDGVPAVYGKDQNTKISSDESGITTGSMGLKDEKLEVALLGAGSTRTLKISVDPRLNSAAEQNAKTAPQTVTVTCKSFEQQP